MRKLTIAFILIYLTIIFMPPILHPERYLIINGDSIGHLYAFNTLKEGNPRFLYLGQQFTGYFLIWLEKISNIRIEYLFMWFNFIMLAIGGLITGLMVKVITKNTTASLLSIIFITFGVSSTRHLFYSGTIFNIIDVIILLPLFIISIYKVMETKKIYWTSFGIISFLSMVTYHPSLSNINFVFGKENSLPITVTSMTPNTYSELILNPIGAILVFFGFISTILLGFCIYLLFKHRIKIELKNIAILLALFIYFIFMIIIGTSGITIFSSRVAINYVLILGIITCLLFGTVMNKINKIEKVILITLVSIGAIPNLVIWLSFPRMYMGG